MMMRAFYDISTCWVALASFSRTQHATGDAKRVFMCQTTSETLNALKTLKNRLIRRIRVLMHD